MKFKSHLIAAAAFLVLAAQAQTVRVANQGDALSMDPHSLNESLQLSVTGNVYEPLVGRNKDLSLAPALATSWKQTSPTVWRFELRKGGVHRWEVETHMACASTDECAGPEGFLDPLVDASFGIAKWRRDGSYSASGRREFTVAN